jgi:glycosyltransferase involved in cell wall biosynthesis
LVTAVAYDVTRLFIGPLSLTPRGIDRVDLLLANHFFAEDNSRNLGVLPTPWGMRVYEAARVRRGLRRLEQLWSENRPAGEDAIWTDLRSRLVSGSREHYHRARRMTLPSAARRLGSTLRATGIGPGRSVLKAVPQGAAYLNVGQIGLAVPVFLRWLERRRDVAPVFMLHDVIPLENPEFVSSSSARHHATMVASTVRHADGLIVTTDHARATVADALARLGRPSIRTLARNLPLPEAFRETGNSHADLRGVRYFVVCGSIEPRKNLGLLHTVWKRLAARMGEATPHLVIVGSPGWNSEGLLDQLERCSTTRRRIHPVAGLSSPALKDLLAGAVGLLMPSWSEGFGLPVLEANALGVPTIASDIPSHREVADSQTILLNPGDPDAWEKVIGSWLEKGAPSVSPKRSNDDAEAYCLEIGNFLSGCVTARAA